MNSGCRERRVQSQMPHMHFLQHHGRGRQEAIGSGVRKGCLAIMVGQGAEQRRFVIPVEYLNHPRFTQLLKEAEEEYGFNHEGAISIPCHVEEFFEVTDLIDKETASHQQHNHHHHHHHHHFLCFKASS